jgi:phosphoribosyl 1,2-cyclic phosphodiesterase
MKIKFWGVRGSIATPLTPQQITDKIREALQLASISDILSEKSISDFIDSLPMSLKATYGGNTTCLEILFENEEIFILDCGTGLRGLGLDLMQRGWGNGNKKAHIYLSHTHWDHVQGIPFFLPLFIPNNKFIFYSGFEEMKKRVEYQQKGTHFPIRFEQMAAIKEFYHVKPENLFDSGDGFSFILKKMVHPGGSYAIRLQEKGKSFIFGSDAEFNIDTIENIDSYKDFFSNADVLVFDTQYTFEDSLQKIDWGHSNASIAIDIAIRFDVKKLILFHHDPSYHDKKLDELHMKALRYRDMSRYAKDLEIYTAHEGLEIII